MPSPLNPHQGPSISTIALLASTVDLNLKGSDQLKVHDWLKIIIILRMNNN